MALLAGSLLSADSGLSAGVNSITIPDSTGNVGAYTSLELAADGTPWVSYYDVTDGAMKLMNCNDPNCAGGDETFNSDGAGGDSGLYTSLEIDPVTDCPTVTYYNTASGDLRSARRGGVGCGVFVSDQLAVTNDVGQYTSLALDSNGYRVVSYYDVTNADLKVLHCPTAACTSPPITTPDPLSAVAALGKHTSLELDANGNPVISYYLEAQTSPCCLPAGDLVVMHCNDPDCAGSNESVTYPDTIGDVGQYSDLELAANGNPVISYYDATNTDLKLMFCNDANCAGIDETVISVGGGLDFGQTTSLELDPWGRPWVSTRNNSGFELLILACGSPCIPPLVAVATDPTANSHGYDSSLKLDAYGRPVVSYRDSSAADLKLLHCGTSGFCGLFSGDSDLDGCTDFAEMNAASGSEMTGGHRNSKNPWDFYDTDGNKVIDLFIDIFNVANAFGADADTSSATGPPEPDGYMALLDRSDPLLGDDPWDMQPPNGTIDLFTDIFGVATQYGHDCT